MPLLPHSAPFFLDFLPFFLMPVNLTSDLYFALAPKINTTLMFKWAGIYRMICLAGDFAFFWSRIIIFFFRVFGHMEGIPYYHWQIAGFAASEALSCLIKKIGTFICNFKTSFLKKKILGLLAYVKSLGNKGTRVGSGIWYQCYSGSFPWFRITITTFSQSWELSIIGVSPLYT